MCGEEALVSAGRAAADDVLELLRVPIAKAMDLSTPKGFDGAVARLGAELRRHAHLPERDAVRAAIGVLDVDWHATTPAQRAGLLRAAQAATGRAVAPVAPRVEATFGRAAEAVVRATRGDARGRQRLAIGADFNALDRGAIAHVTRSNLLFVRDEYGQRLEAFGQRVRAVVGRGLAEGLGRADIAERIAEAATEALVARSKGYWEVVAGSFVGESRSLSQISAYAEAGIERYVIMAVLDEHTTDTCRFLDGKVIATADALRTLERLETATNPLALKTLRPWVRERVGEDGGRTLEVGKGEGATVLAVVTRSGRGVADDRGEYHRALTGRELAPAGVGFPPFHGLCRSTSAPA